MGSRWRKVELADTSCAPVELQAENETKEMPVNEILAELHGSTPPDRDVVLQDGTPAAEVIATRGPPQG